MGIFQKYCRQLGYLLIRNRVFCCAGAILFIVLAFFLFSYHESDLKTQKCCLENNAVLFFPLPGAQSFSTLLLPINAFNKMTDLSYQEVESDGMKWTATALKTDSIGMLLADVSKGLIQEKLLPLIAVVLDNNNVEYLLLVGKKGQVALSSVKFMIEHFCIKSGLGVEVRLPSDWGNNADHIPFYLKIN